MRSPRTSSELNLEGITRGSFILRSALAAASVYGAGTVGPLVRDALAQSDASDALLLDFAFRLEGLEAAFYDEALKQVPGMSSTVRSLVTEFRDHEHEHRRTIEQTILQLGIHASVLPKFDFGNSFSSQARFLEVAQGLEDTGVSAYNGVATEIFSRSILVVAGSIVAIEARHSAVIRDLRGQPITLGAFDKPERPKQVAQKVKPYIHG